jgi:hypothetical protein
MKRIIIRKGKKYIVNVPDWEDSEKLEDGVINQSPLIAADSNFVPETKGLAVFQKSDIVIE